MKQSIRSIAIWFIGIFLTIALFFVMAFVSILFFPFDKKRKITHAQCFWWTDALTALNPYWDVKVEGLDNIDHKKTYVVVSNHQSLADIVLMYKIKMQFKWVAKDSLFKIPVLGWNMQLARHIRLRRKEFSSIKKVYREASRWLRSGMSVVFFPEGTRNNNSAIGEFQNGAFKLAIKEKIPVLPVLIHGTKEAIPKGSWRFTTKISCLIRVFPSIDTATFLPADYSRLSNLARAKLVNN